ncbi:hypothetical protein [Streptomyces sp. NPDC023588]|uniref:hypothetical protein n=1 Tax=Streptomyces sp. NPDC023588 TaxID=3154907 RepID=UPI0033F67488
MSTDTRTLWWSSDNVARRLTEAQYTLGDGPCLTAVTRVAPVLAADLTQGADAARWPVFAQQAASLGVRAVFSLPLGSSAIAIGTLASTAIPPARSPHATAPSRSPPPTRSPPPSSPFRHRSPGRLGTVSTARGWTTPRRTTRKSTRPPA